MNFSVKDVGITLTEIGIESIQNYQKSLSPQNRNIRCEQTINKSTDTTITHCGHYLEYHFESPFIVIVRANTVKPLDKCCIWFQLV